MGRLQLWVYVSTISYCESHYHIGKHWEYVTVFTLNQGKGLAYTKVISEALRHIVKRSAILHLRVLPFDERWVSLRVIVYMWEATQQEQQISMFAVIVECQDQIFSS